MIRVFGVTAFACLFALGATHAQNSVRKTGRIIGVVSDSVSGSPLRDAEVVASGVAQSVKTDSAGRFSIDGLAPGTYQIGVFHPLLESLGITLATQPFTIGPDSAAVVSLAVPSIPSLARRYCGELQSAAPAVLVGRLLDPDTDVPIGGGKVSLEWTNISVSKERGVVRDPHLLSAETSTDGFFKFCGLPSDLIGTLQAAKDGAETPVVPVGLDGALLDFESMSIPNRESSAKGIVVGHVLSSAGKPVAGARVEIATSEVAATTRVDGGFYLPGVKTGTALLVARSLNFLPAAEPINVTSREPLDVVVTLPDKVNILDPVLVTARRNDELDKNGFAARKRSGAGYFFTQEDFDKRRPNNVTDMFRNLPVIIDRPRRPTFFNYGRSGLTPVYASQPGNCVNVFVDGFRWRDMGPTDLNSFVHPRDVIGLEVYRAEDVPIRFREAVTGSCIAVVVWTEFRGKPSKER